jgi:hypothetical protein
MQDEGFSEGQTPNQQGGNPSTMWGMVGAVSGGALGFIVGNVPGLLAGAVAGNRLGAIRDTKGKSVYEVFRVRSSFFPLLLFLPCVTVHPPLCGVLLLSQIFLRLTRSFRYP